MQRVCILFVVGLIACVLSDSDDVAEDKTISAKSTKIKKKTLLKPVSKKETMAMIKKLSRAFRYTIHEKKVTPQYRWLSEGPTGMSFVSKKKEISTNSKEKIDNTVPNLKNQFRLFHGDEKFNQFKGNARRQKPAKKDFTLRIASDSDDSKDKKLKQENTLMKEIIRLKSIASLAPNAKDISLIIRKKDPSIKERSFYVFFENLKSVNKHNFRLTPDNRSSI
ncbi:uncharacterized protein LOC133194705 [Saccostrea echinata]|uniref:uncharacterized protein LOC133194705 n=1 Tax=Saccostrea echinata TaxID=191078 RepID=UPI002A8099FD|nr:uncharacterized protein LOC133194705 [Saccostrea echinata]